MGRTVAATLTKVGMLDDRQSETLLPNSSVYDEAYFLSSACEGLREYISGGIASLKSRELDYLGLEEGDLILDLGCGRGEAAAEMSRRSALPIAMDYSADAVRLTREYLGPMGLVVRGDAANLPFRSEAFSGVLMGDVIEHLPWSMAVEMLREVSRVVMPGGRALVHTSPNTWFIAMIKRPLQLLMYLLRRTEVTDRFAEYDRLRGVMHPNELNPVSLRRLLRQAGVRAKTWVDRDVIRSGESEWTEHLARNRAVRALAAIAGAWPARLVFGNDMFALISVAARRD